MEQLSARLQYARRRIVKPAQVLQDCLSFQLFAKYVLSQLLQRGAGQQVPPPPPAEDDLSALVWAIGVEPPHCLKAARMRFMNNLTSLLGEDIFIGS